MEHKTKSLYVPETPVSLYIYKNTVSGVISIPG